MKYIYNFMIKINIDIYYNEYEFILNILIIIISFIFLLMNILVWWTFSIYRHKNKRNEIQIQRNNIRNAINVRPRAAYINNYIENQDNNNIVHRVDQIDDNNNNIIIKDNFKKHIICDSDNISLDTIWITCIKNPIEIIFIPCKHRCYCNECYNKCKEKYQNLIINCPICKKPILSTKIDKKDETFDIYFDK